MKILATYEYRGRNISVYEDGSCDITDAWDGHLIDGGFENNKQAETYISRIDEE